MLLLTFSFFSYAQTADNEKKDESVEQKSETESAKAENTDAEVVISDEISEEKKEDEKPKPFSVGISNTMSHNLAKERKRFSDGVGISFSAMLPYEINVGINAGFSYVFRYDRTDLYGDSANSSQFDGSPIAVSSSRTFLLPMDFSVTPSIELSSSITSKYGHNAVGNNLNVSLSVSASKSFKINKDWKASLSLTPGYAADIHEKDFYYDSITNDAQFYNPVHQLFVSAGGSLSWKTLSLKLGYTFSTSETYYDEDYEGMGFIDNDRWPFYHTYSIGLGYALSLDELGGLNFGLNFATSGRDRAYGGYGDDYLVPFDPYYSKISLNIGYNYSF